MTAGDHERRGHRPKPPARRAGTPSEGRRPRRDGRSEPAPPAREGRPQVELLRHVYWPPWTDPPSWHERAAIARWAGVAAALVVVAALAGMARHDRNPLAEGPLAIKGLERVGPVAKAPPRVAPRRPPPPAPLRGPGPRLRWPPPPLDVPITVRLGTGYTLTQMDPTRDYIIRMPPGRKLGATVLKGGHNVVLRGGSIGIPQGTSQRVQRQGIYVKDATGTVHIEGVNVDSSGGGPGDGIDIDAPQATVQIENVRATGMHGCAGSVHADVLQPWGGVKDLRVDRLTGASQCQGFQIPIALGPIGTATIAHVNLSYTGTALGPGGVMFWLTTDETSCKAYPTALTDVWLQPKPGRELSTSVWPTGDGRLPCGATIEGGTARWPRLPVSGVVRQGSPPGGDFVPPGRVGPSYLSPGYGP